MNLYDEHLRITSVCWFKQYTLRQVLHVFVFIWGNRVWWKSPRPEGRGLMSGVENTVMDDLIYLCVWNTGHFLPKGWTSWPSGRLLSLFLFLSRSSQFLGHIVLVHTSALVTFIMWCLYFSVTESLNSPSCTHTTKQQALLFPPMPNWLLLSYWTLPAVCREDLLSLNKSAWKEFPLYSQTWKDWQLDFKL